MFPPLSWGGRLLRPQTFFKSLCLCQYLYLCARYLLSVSCVPLLLNCEALCVRYFYVCVYNRPTIAPQHEDATEAVTKRLQRAAIAVPISLLDLVVEEMVLWLQSDC